MKFIGEIETIDEHERKQDDITELWLFNNYLTNVTLQSLTSCAGTLNYTF